MTDTIQHHRRLTAPPHLRGPMHDAPKLLRRKRLAWVRRVSRDYRQHEIAEALGLSRSAVAMLLHRVHQPQPKSAAAIGVQAGRMRSAVSGMPDDARDQLQLLCARTGQTMAEALVQHWLEAHQ